MSRAAPYAPADQLGAPTNPELERLIAAIRTAWRMCTGSPLRGCTYEIFSITASPLAILFAEAPVTTISSVSVGLSLSQAGERSPGR